MNSLKFRFGIWLGKIFFLLSRLRGSRGTALPGLVVERLFPNFLELSRPHLGRLIVITGTNGKTSTQTLLAHSLRRLQPGAVLVNSRGANLSRGLVAEICRNFPLFGKRQFAFSVFEVEEATFPRIAEQIRADLLVVTNFFRDQLDAYGEINRTKQHILNGAQKSSGIKIVANGDDPQVLELHDALAAIAGVQINYVTIAGAGQKINYEQSSAQLPDKGKLNIEEFQPARVTKNLGSSFNYKGHEFELLLPGFYSYYSFAFASKVLAVLGVLTEHNLGNYKAAVAQCKPAFGRGEIINAVSGNKNVGNKNQELQLFLIKNPVGFDLGLDLIAELESGLSLGILINDKIADGRDVSWLWDSQLEKLKSTKLHSIVVGGERALDMALRLKYALPNKVIVTQNLSEFVAELLNQPGPLKVMATYTAMNQVRDLLLERAKISDK
jgi:UDP-N-acetylmuramyl tripeptide synthase